MTDLSQADYATLNRAADHRAHSGYFYPIGNWQLVITPGQTYLYKPNGTLHSEHIDSDRAFAAARRFQRREIATRWVTVVVAALAPLVLLLWHLL